MENNSVHIPVVAICPMRGAADHRAEMTSQLLLGEPVDVIDEQKGEWLLVRSLHDGYEGWCQKVQLAQVSGDLPQLAGYEKGRSGVVNVNGQPIITMKGTPVYQGSINAGPYQLDYPIQDIDVPVALLPNDALVRKHAIDYLNCSYLWGGRSVYGIDCSGLTQMVYRQLGVSLLRDAHLQAAEGESVGFLQEARCGDLAFFDEPDGRITHVGILLNDQEIIHSSGVVRIDPIDHEGIIHRELGKRTHKLRVIKRYW